MSRDLFEEYGIKTKKKKQPVDLFEKEDIYYPKESQGFSGIASDAYNKAIQAAMGLPSALLSIPGEIYGAGKQVVTDPKRVLGNVGAGFGELGHGLLSSLGNTRDYLQKKGLVSQDAPSLRLPESILPKEYNYGEALGVEGEQPGDELLRGIPKGAALSPLSKIIPSVLGKIPGVTNKSIANQLSRHKTNAINEANKNYVDLFSDVKNKGIEDINVPKIEAADIIENSQPKYHEALKNFLKDPTFENAHWAQSDLGYIIRHLQKVDEKSGLSSTQHKTLKNALAAQNRIKQKMFEDKRIKENPNFEHRYNELSGDYAKNVIPYKQLEELSDYENKKITPNNMIKSLLGNDEFMLGLGKRYMPQLLTNKALRSNVAKLMGGGLLGGLGFEEGRKLIR